MSKKILAIINPASSGGSTGEMWPKVKQELNKSGVFFDAVLTERKLHATELTKQALKDGYEMIISVGGDGTTNEIVNGFFENEKSINKDAILAILSMGTGCDFIRTLGFKRGVEAFIQILKKDCCLPCDIIHMKANIKSKEVNCYFINSADFGLGGATCYRVNKTKKILKGKLSYGIAAITSIIKYKNKKIKLVVDGKTYYDNIINSVFICNGQYFGGGMKIAPKAKLMDGSLDIVVIEKANLFQIIASFPKIYSGEHLSNPLVKYIQGEKVKIYCYDPVIAQLDGEQPFNDHENKNMEIDLSIKKEAIKILVS